MPTQKPLPILVPNRRRQPPQSFAWIDHRLRSSGLLPMLTPPELGLYLFLVLAADKDGLSCWRLDRIERELPAFDRSVLWKARDRLMALDLVEFKPWRESDPDGVYQVLSLQRIGEVLSPETNEALSALGRRLRGK
ncbi:MAG: hypothetical protein HQK55_14190 [Deltaproteobacteria bacterium]|nr:hypothetical protein [Deltaproteobacteria bacterium]